LWQNAVVPQWCRITAHENERELNPQPARTETDFRLWLQTELTRRCQHNHDIHFVRSRHSSLWTHQRYRNSFWENEKLRLRSSLIYAEHSAHVPTFKRGFFVKKKTTGKNSVAESAAAYELLAEDAFAFILMVPLRNFGIGERRWFSKPTCMDRTLTGYHDSRGTNRTRNAWSGLSFCEKLTGKIVRTEKFVTNFAPGMTSAALKNLQRQILKWV